MDEKSKAYHCLNPVVIIVFNRPDKTHKLIDALRSVQPNKLYVIADGPRSNNPTDKLNVQEVRAIFDKEVDWNCEVIKIFAEANMGGPKRVPSGLNFVFEKEEQAIILEDDCIPNASFFRFCDELLEKYKYEDRIGTICGANIQFNIWGKPKEIVTENSYFFSRIPPTWGWATWRRVWKKVDMEMTDFPKYRNNPSVFSPFPYGQKYFLNLFSKLYTKERNHWDYKLLFNLFINNQLSVVPQYPLVENIGFDNAGTNFTSKSDIGKKKSKLMHFPLKYPQSIITNESYDKDITKSFFSSNKWHKLLGFLRDKTSI